MLWAYARAALYPRRLEVQVFEVDVSHVVHAARHDDHPRARRLAQKREQVRGEREVPEVVGADLKLESLPRLALGRNHHPGVVHKKVEALVLGDKARPRRR